MRGKHPRTSLAKLRGRHARANFRSHCAQRLPHNHSAGAQLFELFWTVDGHRDSMAAATAPTATTAARGAAGGLSGSAVTRTVRRAEHRKLNRALLPRALRAGNLLRLVQHNLLKVRLAILANIFVDRHCPKSSFTRILGTLPRS